MDSPHQVELLPALQAFHARGWALIPVPHKQKRPIFRDWQHLRLTADELANAFPTPTNVGVLLGEPSGGLIDIDLDSSEAPLLADRFLPPTDAVFGRAAAPRAHRLYLTDEAIPTAKFRDPIVPTDHARAMLVELRSIGAQTLVPPSVHPSGEEIIWASNGEPVEVGADALQRAVARLAAGALLARHWPAAGNRHEAALALSGGLLRAGWKAEETADFVWHIAIAAGDEEADDRRRAVLSTSDTIATGQRITGWPTLARLIDRRVVDRARAWLQADNAGHAPREDEASSGEPQARGREPAQATVLVDLARDAGIELFHDAQGEPYATLPVAGHAETWSLRAKTVRTHLARLFYLARGRAPGGQALADALQVLDGEARFAGQTVEVAVRLADRGDSLFLDLGDPDWRVVVITTTGWSIRPPDEVPVRFRRPRGLLPLPDPLRGGRLDPLRSLLNLGSAEDWLLVVGWLLGCLYPRGPRAILQLLGEQGSAKSTQARTLRCCVDPNVVPLRTQPRDEGDLLIAAINGAIVALDNLSTIPPWLSDALCRLATGGGLSKRELYTDADEVLLEARRPVLLTAIAEVATASDLLDRCLTVTLPAIAPDQRRTEADLDAALAQARPVILGALLDAAVVGLRNLPTTTLTHPPRLADFATWVEACAPALGWEAGAFLDALAGNRRVADAVALEALPVGPVLLAFMDGRSAWEGTATALLDELNRHIAEEQRRERGWPKRANQLSAQLRRLAPNLRRMGISVIHDRSSGSGQRVVVLTRNAGTQDRHGCHHRHPADGSGAQGDDGSSPLSSPHRQTAAPDGGERRGSDPAGDGCDDGDDPTPPSMQHLLTGTAPRPDDVPAVLPVEQCSICGIPLAPGHRYLCPACGAAGDAAAAARLGAGDRP